MIDVGAISGSIAMGKNVWSFLDYVRSVAGADVISGLFKYDGTRVEGSEKISVELHHTEDNPAIWWYCVTAISNYAFIREPVNPSCTNELVGQVVGEEQPDARYWRWIAPTLPGRIYGGGSSPVNLKVDFMVFGYRPKALLKHFGN